MTALIKTKDYNIFKKHENNVPLEEKHIVKIMNSIKAQNMLEFRPIIVDAQMSVIDGQHRIEAAKRLGVEVYYQIKHDATHQDICLANANQRLWEGKHWLYYHCSLGNQDYISIRDFCEENEIGISIFMRTTTGSGTKRANNLRYGKLKFPQAGELEELKKLLKDMNTIRVTIEKYLFQYPKITQSKRLKDAILIFLRNKNVDITTFLEKLTYKADSIRPCVSTHSYYSMFRDIYNWRNQNPI